MELHKQSLVDKREECPGNVKANYNQKQQTGGFKGERKKDGSRQAGYCTRVVMLV